jgi:hypothetical protein
MTTLCEPPYKQAIDIAAAALQAGRKMQQGHQAEDLLSGACVHASKVNYLNPSYIRKRPFPQETTGNTPAH